LWVFSVVAKHARLSGGNSELFFLYDLQEKLVHKSQGAGGAGKIFAIFIRFFVPFVHFRACRKASCGFSWRYFYEQ